MAEWEIRWRMTRTSRCSGDRDRNDAPVHKIPTFCKICAGRFLSLFSLLVCRFYTGIELKPKMFLASQVLVVLLVVLSLDSLLIRANQCWLVCTCLQEERVIRQKGTLSSFVEVQFQDTR